MPINKTDRLVKLRPKSKKRAAGKHQKMSSLQQFVAGQLPGKSDKPIQKPRQLSSLERAVIQLTGKKKTSEIIGTLKALKQQQRVNQILSQKVQRLAERHKLVKLSQLIKHGLKQGKLTPGQCDWAEKLGRSSINQLKSYLESAPVITKLGRRYRQAPVSGRSNMALGTTSNDIAKNLGISNEEMYSYNREPNGMMKDFTPTNLKKI